jgi:hypothetical protein
MAFVTYVQKHKQRAYEWKTHLEKVNDHLQDLSLDVNSRSGTFKNTILHDIVIKGNIEGVKLLLTHPNIEVNRPNQYGKTPIMKSAHALVEIIKLLLMDPRVDVNIKAKNGYTLLICLVYHRRIHHMEWLFAVRGHQIKSESFTETHNTMSGAPKTIFEITEHKPTIELLTKFRDDPKGTTAELRKKFKYNPVGKLFGLIVLFSDGYLQPSKVTDLKVVRLFSMLSQLSMDLQMVFSHRFFKSSLNVIPPKDVDWSLC